MLFRYESLASALACVEAVAALYSSDVKISPRDFDSRQTTSLGAITVRSAEQKRGLANFKPDLECTHHYADRKFGSPDCLSSFQLKFFFFEYQLHTQLGEEYFMLCCYDLARY